MRLTTCKKLQEIHVNCQLSCDRWQLLHQREYANIYPWKEKLPWKPLKIQKIRKKSETILKARVDFLFASNC